MSVSQCHVTGREELRSSAEKGKRGSDGPPTSLRATSGLVIGQAKAVGAGEAVLFLNWPAPSSPEGPP